MSYLFQAHKNVKHRILNVKEYLFNFTTPLFFIAIRCFIFICFKYSVFLKRFFLTETIGRLIPLKSL